MRNVNLYTRCYIGGHGETFKDIGKKVELSIIDLSAEDSYVIVKDNIEEDKVYNFKMYFSSALVELSLDVKGKLYKNHKDINNNSYILKFIDLSEEKKVEIDEILKQTCIDKEVTAINKCDSGGCVLKK